VGTTAWSFLSLLLLIIVTRFNGVDASGLFSFSYAVAMIMYSVACYGGRTYQVSDLDQEFRSGDYVSLRIAMSAVALVATGAFVLVNDFSWSKAALILILVAQRVFDAVADALYGILQKAGQLYISGKSLLYKSLLALAGFVAVDLLTRDLLLASLALPLSSLAYLVAYDAPHARVVERFKLRFDRHTLTRILATTVLTFVITLLIQVFSNVARYAVDIYHPTMQWAFGILIMPLSFVTLLFSFILVPMILRLSEFHQGGDYKALRHTVNQITAVMAGIGLVTAGITYLIGPELLQLVFGQDFTSYRLDLTLVIAIGTISSISSIYGNVTVIVRKMRVSAMFYSVALIALIALCIPLVSRFSIRGAILAYLGGTVIQMLLVGGYSWHLVKGDRPRPGTDIGQPANEPDGIDPA
jgi:O-antigen/teichoic acid export membrane protein